MMKLGGFLARKTPLSEAPAPPTPSDPDNPLELDEELFSARGSQLGAENEALRNLMVDASAKIGELDLIKSTVGKLLDPVGKALRAIEAEQAEKFALETVLNHTRAAYDKLRKETTALEKKFTSTDAECRTLRQELTAALGQLKATESSKAEMAIDLATRRALIAEMEPRLTQMLGENKAMSEENCRLAERILAADKRIYTLESDLNGVRQRLQMADDEKRAQQTMLERASGEAAQLSRKLAETEASLSATHNRLRHVEANFAELDAEHNRLANTHEEMNERHGHELTSQRMRFEALQARASAGEKLLGEARQHLLARAEEIGAMDRRLSEIAGERDGLQARVSELEAERITRESAMRELEQARSSSSERTNTLTRAFSAKEAALAQAEETIGALNERLAALEQGRLAEQQTVERSMDELRTALRREQMERSVVEGALETARKDFSRVMRELMALQRKKQDGEPAPQPKAANAA